MKLQGTSDSDILKNLIQLWAGHTLFNTIKFFSFLTLEILPSTVELSGVDSLN
jgi:hypothetical protein